MPGSSWTDATERQLLLNIIASSSIATPKWDDIAKSMGHGYTASAVMQKFNRMKREAKDALAGGDGANAMANGGGKGKKTAGAGKKTGGKRKAADIMEGEDEEEVEEKVDSPQKKVKVKAEEDGEEGGEGEDEGDFFT